MKHLLNTLYVTTQGAYLARDGETIVVRVEHETKLHVPIITLSGVVCFGQVSMSPPLMGLCAERGVGVSFLSEYGRFLARVVGPVSGNVLLRREQYRRSDDKIRSAAIAVSVVSGKIANSRTVLQRALRDHSSMSGRDEVLQSVKALGYSASRLGSATSLDTIRGIEGEAASAYFGVFDHLVVAQKEDFVFRGRKRRPPLDNMNAMLSFLYTLLTNDVRSALECVGIDPAVGFLHRDRPGRPSLALDLVEEMRPVLADRLVLSLVNRRQVNGGGFVKSETGAVMMDEQTRKQMLVAWQKRKKDEIVHPFIGEKIMLGLVPHVQALLLARHLRGDLDVYPPFFWR